MKTIIAGGRDFKPLAMDRQILDELKETLPITEVVCGMARGADAFGKEWAEAQGIPVKEFPAQWNLYGRRAGYMRNSEMGEYAEALVAFPGGFGTTSMIGIATKKGLKIEIISGGTP